MASPKMGPLPTPGFCFFLQQCFYPAWDLAQHRASMQHGASGLYGPTPNMGPHSTWGLTHMSNMRPHQTLGLDQQEVLHRCVPNQHGALPKTRLLLKTGILPSIGPLTNIRILSNLGHPQTQGLFPTQGFDQLGGF